MKSELSILAPIANSVVTDLQQTLFIIGQVSQLFDDLPNLVFFIKDDQARYQFANQTLVQRCGCRSREELIGLTASDVFPAVYGADYTSQDRQVLNTGLPIERQLELHLYPAREPGWCLTSKAPLKDIHGDTIGLIGISRDLEAMKISHPEYQNIAEVEQYIRSHCSEEIALSALTSVAGGMSIAKLERLCKQIYQLTPTQLIQHERIKRALILLRGNLSITDIAHQCGYSDHSAFSRQFKNMTGMPPRRYRQLVLLH
ncbi:AraC family transcriptional regulator [Vibrio ziniensis]|uniref:AraC family transcriptional regulator n=1 Tax=Vibrio ziniensis TaxID=2711221 RepID=A0A6G7CJ59_9VIBR|nr:AraC family transcriptional regulator [Vibrio ziniensis]QIH42083.1 AraC family transcriptional regulator [Vibrio ziniensis]